MPSKSALIVSGSLSLILEDPSKPVATPVLVLDASWMEISLLVCNAAAVSALPFKLATVNVLLEGLIVIEELNNTVLVILVSPIPFLNRIG